MLTEAGCRNRRRRLWEKLPSDVEWIVVGDPRHVNYLSAFWVNPISASMGQRAFLVLDREGASTLVCDEMAHASAILPAYVDDLIVEKWYGGGPSVMSRESALVKALEGACTGFAGRRVLVENEWFPAITSRRLGISVAADDSPEPSLSTVLRELRRKKETDEIETLRTCMIAGKAGHERAREVVAAGVSELELYAEIQAAAVKSVGQPILVYGDFRASSPTEIHGGGGPTDYVLKDGDSMILDFSVVVGGYRSDFTNTLAVGRPTGELQGLMSLCKQALDAGQKALRPGASAKSIHAAVAEPMAEAGHPLEQHAGHGLGLEHPEAPSFIPESEEVLQSGEVVTLEPGAYVSGIGSVRVEHNFLVTDSGCERLSDHRLEL